VTLGAQRSFVCAQMQRQFNIGAGKAAAEEGAMGATVWEAQAEIWLVYLSLATFCLLHFST